MATSDGVFPACAAAGPALAATTAARWAADRCIAGLHRIASLLAAEVRRRVQSIETREGFAPFREYRTWYRVTGDLEAQKAPVVILHGGPGAAHNYVDAYRLLATQGRAVIHYDQLGCGNSTLLSDKGADFWTPE